MFYDESNAIKACEDEPSLIFDLINEGHKNLVDKILAKELVNINTTNDEGNDVLTYLLKRNYYDLVQKHMKNKNWNINHQNNNGETFAHILATKKYLDVMDVIKILQKNPNFIPNIRDNKGETILDRSITNNYLYTTIKILEDERFDNVDLIVFKKLYENYIKNESYGSYSKINNLEVILDNLSDKNLLPKMQKLLNLIKNNLELIKEEVSKNKIRELDNLIYSLLEESAS